VKLLEKAKLRRLWLVALFPLGLGVTWLARRNPALTEQFYSRTVYPVLMTLLSNLSSLFPYALIEVILVAGGCWLARYLIQNIHRAIGQPQERKPIFLRVTSTLLAGASVIYFLFVLTCGINYHRLSFGELSGLPIRPSSTQELYALCQELVERTNVAREQVTVDERGVFTLSEQNMYQLARDARVQFEALGEGYPYLGGHYSQPKPLFCSELLSYFKYLGIFACFTGEPVINVFAPDYNLPVTMCHEQAHLRGFMREDEANFIAYLACVGSDDPDFVYSGLAQALIYSTNALYSADSDLYYQLRAQFSPGLEADLADDSAYWDAHDGKVAQVADAWNDTYLKANHQSDGVKSYGRMVDLLLADYRDRHGIE